MHKWNLLAAEVSEENAGESFAELPPLSWIFVEKSCIAEK